jgi:transcriptional regulator
MAINPNLLKGALETVILETISEGATYGYEIARALRETSGGQLIAQDGTLYPALHRLERRGYLQSTWKQSPQGRDRKHYRLTKSGRERLAARRVEWEAFSASINRILKPSANGPQGAAGRRG